MWRKRNEYGETRRQEIERRLTAVEQNIQQTHEMIAQMFYDHLREFHPGQDGLVKEPEE